MNKPSSFYVHVYSDGRVKLGVTGDVDGGCAIFRPLVESMVPPIQKVLYEAVNAAQKKKDEHKLQCQAARLAKKTRLV
jgi:hypothetical protein